MVAPQRRRWLVPLLTALLVLIADQASKIWIVATLGPQPGLQAIHLVSDWLNIVYTRNTGVAFGLFQNMSPVLTVTALLISIGAIYVYATYLPNTRWSIQITLGLILGGAGGNIIDRLRLGYVVDFIQVGWWPVFNLADSAISVGATMLAVHLLLFDDREAEVRAPGDEALLGELLHRDPVAARPGEQRPSSPDHEAQG